MKKLIVLLFLCLFLLTGCYSYDDIQAVQDKADEAYAELESQYYAETSRADKLESELKELENESLTYYRYESALNELYYEFLTIYYYSDEIENSKILHAINNMDNIFDELGY